MVLNVVLWHECRVVGLLRGGCVVVVCCCEVLCSVLCDVLGCVVGCAVCLFFVAGGVLYHSVVLLGGGLELLFSGDWGSCVKGSLELLVSGAGLLS